jgi:hypothetical protein
MGTQTSNVKYTCVISNAKQCDKQGTHLWCVCVCMCVCVCAFVRCVQGRAVGNTSGNPRRMTKSALTSPAGPQQMATYLKFGIARHTTTKRRTRLCCAEEATARRQRENREIRTDPRTSHVVWRQIPWVCSRWPRAARIPHQSKRRACLSLGTWLASAQQPRSRSRRLSAW